MHLGVIMFRAMRRVARILLWLTVIVGMLFPMIPNYEIAYANTAAHGHGGSAHAAAHGHPHDADCDSGGCEDAPAWEGCLEGAIHCVTALAELPSDVSLILPRDAGHRLHPTRAGPHQAPETEVPPPRS